MSLQRAQRLNDMLLAGLKILGIGNRHSIIRKNSRSNP